MTVLVETDRDQITLHTETLGGELTTLPSPDKLVDHLRRHPREHAILLGEQVDVEEAIAVAQHFRTSHPQVGVILLRKRVEPDILQQALRAGVREVVEADDPEAVRDAVHRAHTLWSAMADRLTLDEGVTGRMITVFSTKGGVGKTTVATNMAVALADGGKRVCLVDLDIQCGDVAIMLQLSPSRTLADLASFGDELDAGAVESLSLAYDSLAVIASPVRFESSDDVTADRTAALLDQLRELFEVIVVDTSGQFDDHALAALDRADDVVLVGTLDIPSLKNLKLATGTLDLLEVTRDRWHLVLNRADQKVGLAASDFSSTLDLKPAATLPSHREVLAAVNQGQPVVRAHPKNPVSKALIGLAGDLVPATGAVDSPARGRRRKKVK